MSSSSLRGRSPAGRDARQGSHRHQSGHPVADARRGEGRQRGRGGEGGGGSGVRRGGGHEDAELTEQRRHWSGEGKNSNSDKKYLTG